MNVEVGVAFTKTGIRTIDDARKREVPSAGTGGTASSTVVPFLLNRLAGTRFKLIAGYKSANEALLTMERGEVDTVGAIGLTTIMARHADRLKDGTIALIYQSALTRHPSIPNVPTIGEVGTGKDEKLILDLFASGSAIGRALIGAARDPCRSRRHAAPRAGGGARRPGTGCAFEEGQPHARARLRPRSSKTIVKQGAGDAKTGCG